MHTLCEVNSRLAQERADLTFDGPPAAAVDTIRAAFAGSGLNGSVQVTGHPSTRTITLLSGTPALYIWGRSDVLLDGVYGIRPENKC
jgi:hypothetical protein